MEGKTSGPHTSRPYNPAPRMVLMQTVRRREEWWMLEAEVKARAR